MQILTISIKLPAGRDDCNLPGHLDAKLDPEKGKRRQWLLAGDVQFCYYTKEKGVCVLLGIS